MRTRATSGRPTAPASAGFRSRCSTGSAPRVDDQRRRTRSGTSPTRVDRLADGSLNLPSVRLLASHLTTSNHQELLSAASGKSKRAVEELLAQHFPQPYVASSVRKLPAPRRMPAPPIAAAASTAAVSVKSAGAAAMTPPLPAPPTRRPVVAPLAPDRYEIRFTASATTCEKLRLAQDMLRHAVPTGAGPGSAEPAPAGWARGVARPGLPRIRTCGPPASGSSGHGFAARSPYRWRTTGAGSG